MKRYALILMVNVGFVVLLISQDLPFPDSIIIHLNSKISYTAEKNINRAEDPVVNFVSESEPNDNPSQAQQLVGPFPVGVNGTATVSDLGSKSVMGDDVEDLYKITIASNYVKLNLYDFTADLDLFLFKISGITTTIMGYNHGGTTEEEYERDDLDPGTYYVGVSIYDPYPIQNSSSYKLVITADTATTEVDTVHIADPNFLQALIEEGVDTDGDQVISHDEAEAIISLDVSYREIQDLTGIEAFTNLSSLFCQVNLLTQLDISHNVSLGELDCRSNELTTLDVSNNIHLKELYCNANELTSLNISMNSELEKLTCCENQLTMLDISNNPDLIFLMCRSNDITSLDFSNNAALAELMCSSNQITSLDLSPITELRYLECNSNELTSLNTSDNALLEWISCYINEITGLDISNNPNLICLHTSHNPISNIDVSNNPALKYLTCTDNLLSTLDVSNNSSLEILEIDEMPTLGRVCVWELPFPPVNVEIDTTGSPNVFFTTVCEDIEAPDLYVTEDSLYQSDNIDLASSEDGIIYIVPPNTDKNLDAIRTLCLDSVIVEAYSPITLSLIELNVGNYWLYAVDKANNISDYELITILADIQIVEIVDINFLNALIDIGVDADGDNQISYAEAETIHSLDVSNSTIVDMTGIEAFSNLESLYCIGNQLAHIELSNCPSLNLLDCGFNQITTLDLSNNSELNVLYAGWNQLAELELSQNTSLTYLDCGYNKLGNLDLSNHSLLTELYCSQNQIININVFNCNSLTVLDCGYNEIPTLDVSDNILLEELYCGWNQLSTLEVSNNTALRVLYCSSNNLSKLDISKNTILEYINLENMQTLNDVCIWILPFPPEGVEVVTTGSPYINFTTECSSTGIEEQSTYVFSIYPIPTYDLLNIETNRIGDYSLEIKSLNGQLIHKQEYYGITNQIDLSFLMRGVYIITIRSNNIIKTEKIVKL